MSSIPLPALNIQPAPNPLDQYAKALSVKSMIQGQQIGQQELQGEQLKNQLTQRSIADEQSMTKSMSEWDGKDPNDLPAIILKNGGSANAVFGVRKQLLDQRQAMSKIALDDSTTGKNTLDAYKTRNDQIAGSLESLVDPTSVKDADLYTESNRTVNDLLTQKLIDQPHAAQLQQQIESLKDNPDQLRTAIDHYAKMHMGASALAEQSKSDADTFLKRVQGSTDQWKEIPGTGMFTNFVTGETKSPAGDVMSPAMMEGKYVKIQQQQAQHLPISPDDAAFAKGYEKFKTLVPQFNIAMQNGLLTDPAKDMAADKYAQTGQLPAGMRSPALVSSIIDRAAQRHAGENLALNGAAYKANSDSLTSIQKNMDQVSAFENTAGKNLDTFLQSAGKLVDTGSPLLNKPFRELQAAVTGNPDVIAARTAGTTAMTEIAKVLNSSNASGVLSDSARNEVNGLIGPGATLKQIISAANILKQDMANRHQSYQMQIQDIKGRLGAANSTAPPAGNAAQPNAVKTLSQAQIQQAAKDHNVSVEEATRQAKQAGYSIQ